MLGLKLNHVSKRGSWAWIEGVNENIRLIWDKKYLIPDAANKSEELLELLVDMNNIKCDNMQ